MLIFMMIPSFFTIPGGYIYAAETVDSVLDSWLSKIANVSRRKIMSLFI